MKMYAEFGFEDENGKETHLLRFAQDISEVAVGKLVEFAMTQLKNVV